MMKDLGIRICIFIMEEIVMLEVKHCIPFPLLSPVTPQTFEYEQFPGDVSKLS